MRHPVRMGCFYALTVILFTVILLESSTFAETTLHVSSSDSATLEFLISKKISQIEPNSEFSGNIKEPAMLSSSGKIPILILPIHSASANVEINAPALKTVLGDLNQEEVSRLLSTTMVEIAEIQSLIRKRKLNEAQSKLTALQNHYPKVRFFDFIQASLFLIQGNRSDAESAIKRGLKAHPDYEEGIRFQKELSPGKEKTE